MISKFSSKKKAPKISTEINTKKSSGFALMVALGLMSFVLVIILGLSTLVQVNSRLTSSGKDLATAKQNALFALNLAIGDLQNEMGPDQRISATASILDEFPETEIIDGVNNPYWTGAWNSNDSLDGIKVDQVVSNNRSFSDGKPSNFRRWLISTPINDNSISPEERIAFAKNFSKNSRGAILMVGAGTVGDESTEENSVYVPRQIINKELEKESGYAYWVGDEGVKTRVAGAKQGKIESNLDQILNVNNADSPRLNAIDGFTDVEDISDQSDKILTIGTAQFAFNEALGGNIDAFKNKYHSLSAFSRGLMVDVKYGGIRKDLSLLFASESLPIEYHEVPIFTYDNSEGPFWNYAQRYHNIYKKIRNDGGRNYLKTSDFWEDAEVDIPNTEVKYSDLPIPVLARMQVIFSLHKQRNTWNGSYISLLEPYTPIEDNLSGIVSVVDGSLVITFAAGHGGGQRGRTQITFIDISGSTITPAIIEGETYEAEILNATQLRLSDRTYTEAFGTVIVSGGVGSSGGGPGGPGGPGGGPGGPGGGPGGPGGPGGGPVEPISPTRTNTFTDWEPFGGAEITEDGLFIIPDTAEVEAGYSLGTYQAQEREAYPFIFTGDGSIVINASVPDGSSIELYFKFAQTTDINPENDFISETITISGDTLSAYVIDVPSQEINLFDTLTMHIVTRNTVDSIEGIVGPVLGPGLSVGSVSVTDDARNSSNLILDGIAKPQDNNQEILQLMMTPIFYLWNPYNIEIVMDSHPQNHGSYEYFYGPPDIEFTFDDREWIDLRDFGSFQFGLGKELLAIWSSNNRYNRATGGEKFEIPAGEFRFNRVIPTMVGEWPDYNKMQFFDIYSYNYSNLFSTPGTPVVGMPNDYSPVVANWLQTTNQNSGFADDAFTGLFTPIVNPDGAGDSNQSKLKKLVTHYIPGTNFESPRLITYGPYKFNIRLKNQFFISRFSLGAGWNSFNPNYDVNRAGSYLFDKRMIGALNIDMDEQVEDRPYLQSTLPNPLDVGWSQLTKVVDDQGRWGDIRFSPKIALNVDIRGFSEGETPGKHAFFIDPANTYYYDDESNDQSLALSPFRIYVKEIAGTDIIKLNNEDQVGFETIAGDTLFKCVSKELPLIPLLSITQLDHAPLGRDTDHFAYYSGRRNPGSRWHYETSSLANERIIFREKANEKRPMAPSFNMAVGNSWAHPTIPLNDIVDPDDTYEGYATDRSYLLNETLFDSYFFTGLAFPSGPFVDEMPEMSNLLSDWVSGQSKLPNSNYIFKTPSSLSFKETMDTLSFENIDTIDLFAKIANFIEVEGAFNINSTSVDSWTAQLSALRGKSVLYDNSDYGNYNIDDTNLENTPVLSQAIPAEKSLENSAGTIESIVENSWSHYRSLDDSQIVKLAEEIVKQIKARGPFLSLSQFFNREISDRFPYNLKGAIQTAIDESLINLESPRKNVASALAVRFDENPGNKQWISKAGFDSQEVFEGDSNEGLPGYITQASLMRPLSPILSARSDTFIIRAYGDTKQNGEIKSKVWCEAVVQRRIDLVDQEKTLFDAKYDKEDPNAFNRKFEVVSFRWLNADEI